MSMNADRERAWEQHKRDVGNSRHRRQGSFDAGFAAGVAAARQYAKFVVTDEAVREAWHEAWNASKKPLPSVYWRFLQNLGAVVVAEDDPRVVVSHPRPVGWERLRIDRGWPTPNHMRRTADGLDSMTFAKYGDVLRYVADLCDVDLRATKEG